MENRKERKVGEAAGLAGWPGFRDSLGHLFWSLPSHSHLPSIGAHLRFSPSSVHSQSDGESTANDMDFKEGAEEVAAAQGNHFLWGQRQGWALGVCGGRVWTKPSRPCKLDLGPGPDLLL